MGIGACTPPKSCKSLNLLNFFMVRCTQKLGIHALHNAETLDITMIRRFRCMSAWMQGFFHRFFFIFLARVSLYFSLYYILLTLFYFSLKRRVHYTLIHKIIENAYMAMTLGSVVVTQIVYPPMHLVV